MIDKCFQTTSLYALIFCLFQKTDVFICDFFSNLQCGEKIVETNLQTKVVNGLNSLTLVEFLTTTSTVSDIIVNVVVIIGGIMGLNYVKKLREKQKESTFNYLTKLNVRLKYFEITVEEFAYDIKTRLVPKRLRRDTSAEKILTVTNMFTQLTKNAEETLKFLKNENDQMPATRGWVDCFNTFIEFLVDSAKLEQETYSKWDTCDNPEEEVDKYISDHLENIRELIRMVHQKQCDLEDELFIDES